MTKNIVLIGAPGCGKGTMGEKLSNKYNIPHISTGDLIRKVKEDNLSDQQKLLFQCIDEGNLVPDDLILQILKEHLNSNELNNGVILDGFPRTLNQANKLDLKIDHAIYINTSFDLCTERILSRNQGRADDEEEITKKRILVYLRDTYPIISYYQNMGVLIEVDGNNTRDSIFEQIIKKIEA